MKRRYIYTNKKHLKRSIMSFFFGVLCAVSMITVIVLTYRSGGVSMPGYGLTGFLSAIFSATGLGLGISGVMQKDCFKLFAILGIVLNALVLGGLVWIVLWGAR